jgi:hypothetical protein
MGTFSLQQNPIQNQLYAEEDESGGVVESETNT